MADVIEIKVEGLKEFEAELLGLPPKIADQTLQAALTMAALPIVNEARARHLPGVGGLSFWRHT